MRGSCQLSVISCQRDVALQSDASTTIENKQLIADS
jgi:hypothetical protein